MKLINVCLVTVALFLTACSSSEDNLERNNTNNKNMQYTVVTLVDGRKIECIEYKPGLTKLAISCNWSTPLSK